MTRHFAEVNVTRQKCIHFDPMTTCALPHIGNILIWGGGRWVSECYFSTKRSFPLK